MKNIIVGIYKITNTQNGKVYIGQSVDILRRWRKHLLNSQSAKSHEFNSPLHRAFKKYNISSFSFDIIEYCDKKSLNEKEKYWINFYNSRNKSFGYNIAEGGSNSHPVALSQDDVDIIKTLLNDTNISQLDISKKFNVTQRTISYINKGSIWFDENIKYPIRTRTSTNICPLCGRKMNKKSNICSQCRYIQLQNPKMPTREELKTQIREKQFSVVAKNYGVSTSTIRRWCKRLNLPHEKRQIEATPNNEWLLI